MSGVVVALIAVGAVAHASWNLAIKRSGAGGPIFIWLASSVSSVVVLPFGVWALVTTTVDLRVVLLACSVSAILHVGYFLLLQRGYVVGDVSVVYPLARGTGPLLSVILAMVFLGERPGVVALLGAATVVAGVVVIGLAGGRAGMRNARAGVVFGLLTGVMIAMYTLWDASAVTLLAVAPVLLNWGTTLGEVALLSPFAVRGRGRILSTWRAHWKDAVIVGVLSPLSYIAILIAMQLAPVSIIAPAREVSVVLVGLAGWLLFKEPHPVQRMLGAVVVLGGVALLALS